MSSAPAKTGPNFLLRALKPCLPGPRTGSGLGGFSQTCRAVRGEREGRKEEGRRGTAHAPCPGAAPPPPAPSAPGRGCCGSRAPPPSLRPSGPGRAVSAGDRGPGMSLREQRAGTGQGAAGTGWGRAGCPRSARVSLPGRDRRPALAAPRPSGGSLREVRALYVSFEK